MAADRALGGVPHHPGRLCGGCTLQNGSDIGVDDSGATIATSTVIPE